MGNISRLLSNGRKILLSTRGKQTCMQILDESDNLVFVRCKAIKTSTKPVSTAAPVRMSIGFIPQKLKSHANDRTMQPIGFVTDGKRIKTAAPAKRTTTITKTDFDLSQNEIHTYNVQRKYDEKGNFTGVRDIKSGRTDDLYSKQQVLIDTAKAENDTFFAEQNKLINDVQGQIDALKRSVNEMSAEESKIKTMISDVDSKINDYMIRGIYLDAYSEHWNRIFPNLAAGKASEYAKGITDAFQFAKGKVSTELENLYRQNKKLENLLAIQQKEIATNNEFIRFAENKKAEISELMQTNCWQSLSQSVQRELCKIQRQITELVEKFNS